jgi:hypothetical protein
MLPSDLTTRNAFADLNRNKVSPWFRPGVQTRTRHFGFSIRL